MLNNVGYKFTNSSLLKLYVPVEARVSNDETTDGLLLGIAYKTDLLYVIQGRGRSPFGFWYNKDRWFKHEQGLYFCWTLVDLLTVVELWKHPQQEQHRQLILRRLHA